MKELLPKPVATENKNVCCRSPFIYSLNFFFPQAKTFSEVSTVNGSEDIVLYLLDWF